jgi:hypothetical protein
MFVVKQVAVVAGAVRFFEPGRAVTADRQQALGETALSGSLFAFNAFANRNRNGGCQALASQGSKLPRQAMRFIAFNVETQRSTFLPYEAFYLP